MVGQVGCHAPQGQSIIQVMVSDRMDVNSKGYNNFVSSLESCKNENVSCVIDEFMKDPIHSQKTKDFLNLVSTACCPKDIQDGISSSVHPSNSKRLFTSLLGFLTTNKERFSSEDLMLYNKLNDRLLGGEDEVKSESTSSMLSTPFKKEAKASSDGDKTKFDLEREHDKLLWEPVMPLFEKYGRDISKNLTTLMLNTCVDAWCQAKGIDDREQVMSRLNDVFNGDVIHCLRQIDFLTDRMMGVVKNSSSASAGSSLRDFFEFFMDAIKSLPVAMRGKLEPSIDKPTVPDKDNVLSDKDDTLPEPNIISRSGSHGSNINYGGNAYATINERSGTSSASPIIADPWSAVAEKLLAADNLTSDQRYSLLKVLIDAMGSPREKASSSPPYSPVLNHLHSIGNQAPPSSFTSLNDNKFTYPTLPVDRDKQRLPNSELYTGGSLRSNTSLMQASMSEDSVMMGEDEQKRSDPVNRQFSTRRSVGDDMSTMSPPQSPLNNFNIGNLSPKQYISPLASLALYRQPGADLSAVVAENGLAANEGFRRVGAASRSDSTSSVESNSSGINTADLSLLKHWLKDEVKENEDETTNIDKLILREEGLYTQTMEHFLKRAFLAEPGSEEYSDMQQAYINESFRKMKSHEDFLQLSRSAQALVDKYEQKRSSKVFTTTPGVRRSLSTQMSRP